MAISGEISFKSSDFSQHPDFWVLVDSLSPNSPPEVVKAALSKIALHNLEPLAKEPLIAKIAQRTRHSKKLITETFAQLQLHGDGAENDIALTLMRRTLEVKFSGGKHLMRAEDGSFLFWHGTHWNFITEQELRASFLHVAKNISIQGRTPPKLSRQAYEILRDVHPTSSISENQDQKYSIINCLNCELWIAPNGNVEQKPHNPESKLTYCLNVEYDPAATAVKFDDALLGVFAKASDPAGMVRHWNEIMGYAIQHQRDIPAFFLLIGDGNNGKSKLLQTMERLVGPKAVLNGQIQTFYEDRFNIASLVGKQLFVDDDMKFGARLNDGIIKKLSEDKKITTRRAFEPDSFSFCSRALLMLAGNSYPTSGDISHGFRRRINVVPFNRRFSQKDDKPQLFNEIWAEEMSGVLNRAIAGLQRLRKRGRFEPPLDCENAKKTFIAAANPLTAFLEDRTERDPQGSIFLSGMRDEMKTWAVQEGLKTPVPQNILKSQLTSLGYEVTRVNGYNRVKGLKLRSGPQPS